MRHSRVFLRLALGGGLLLGPTAVARADGGTVRASVVAAGWRVTVFTAPTPPRAGPVDVSVLVQDAATGRPDPGHRVRVRAEPRDRSGRPVEQPATADAATNKLLVAATIDLPEPGWWAVRVRVEADGRSAEVGFELEVGDRPPRWLSLAGWVGWPAAAVAVFAAHRALVRRKAGRRA
ncbi:MAG: hypothetical protein K2X87_12625 [Gemmataceae bacterium]|nr:hypothetical protein [Gemmataceae bacterium]